MHTDARTLPAGHTLDGDVCIVGAGAAGIALALDFIGRTERVILLEGGGFDREDALQSLYRGEIVGRPYYPLEAARLHYFGGTTGHWGGYCSPLDDIDFEARPWVPESGWPISRAILDPFYARAHPLLDLGPYAYDVPHWQQRDARRELLPLDRTVLQEKLWQFSAPTRFGSKFHDPIVQSPNVHLYTHANVVQVVANEAASAIEAVTVRHFDGREFTVRAKWFVLACSTMQNVRLLLASNARAAAGLGNQHDQVGRCFMEHIEMPGGMAHLTRAQSMYLYAHDFGVTTARAELRLTDAQQRDHQVLNATVALEAPPEQGEAKSTFELEPPDVVEGFRRDTRDSLPSDYRSAEGAHDAASIKARPTFSLMIRQEQAPNPASRVTIGRDVDALGVPRVRFDWQLTPLDKRSIRTLYTNVGREFGRLGLGRVQLRDWLLQDDTHWPALVSGGWHDIGGTRMHADPRRGVVDAECRVHGLANLFLAGAGVFTTAGAANPTLTIVALALRLGDHLRARAV
ncbi:MAG: GMC family oxidoreductase [Gemmatimonas sp.]|uniref:GMC oxidoreductase n=1 Tax=Gemmatimonas sp. TaxID=1962908 RepID=UPI0031C55A9B|nr:GMC family oxidoreductase [Gemmatimonas sp.]